MKVIQELVSYFERRGKLTEKQLEGLMKKGFLAAEAPVTMVGHCDQIGQTFYFQVTGDIGGTVWGTDVYTGDSALATACVHAGLVQVGKTAVVRVTVVAPANSYQGSVRNGVTTHSYGPYGTAYRVDRA
jgi:hypothetical protein